MLPVHNRAATTLSFARCLTRQELRDWRLILIDDGSTDGTAAAVLKEIPGATVLRGDGRLWWAGSLQKGYEWLSRAGADPESAVLIINDDTEFGPDFLSNGLKILGENPDSLLLARCFSKQTGKLIEVGTHVDWRRFKFEQADESRELNCLSTRGLFLRTKDFLALGGFHPRLLPHYASDYEFTIRAHRRGFKLVCDPRLNLSVDESTSGYHGIEDSEKSLFRMLKKKFFSIKTPANPFYWTAFLLLACPWPWKFVNIIKIWFGTVKSIAYLIKLRIRKRL